MINRVSRTVSQYSRVEEDLRRRILAGEFCGGTALPGELLLSDHYGVSRKTLRKALENLRTQNFIRKHQGCGSFVIPAEERVNMPRCTGKISVLLPGGRAEDPFAGELLAGIYRQAAGTALEVTLLPQETPVSVLLEMYYNFETDAFLWGSVPHPLPEAAAEIARRRIPQVLVNERAENTASVLYDSFPAWCALLHTFACAGHRNAVFIDRRKEHFWTIRRQNAFLEAAARFGVSAEVFKMDEKEDEQLLAFIKNNPEYTAYAVASPFSQCFQDCAARAGRRLPQELSWAEFTPGDIASFPETARIYISARQMGSEAVRLLTANNFAEDPAPEIQVPCFAVMGLSVAPCQSKGGQSWQYDR